MEQSQISETVQTTAKSHQKSLQLAVLQLPPATMVSSAISLPLNTDSCSEAIEFSMFCKALSSKPSVSKPDLKWFKKVDTRLCDKAAYHIQKIVPAFHISKSASFSCMFWAIQFLLATFESSAKLKAALVAIKANITSEPKVSLSEQRIFWALRSIVAIAPLPLGSNRPLPMAIISLCTGALLTSWVLLQTLKSSPLHVHSKDIKWALLGYAIVCLWIAIQWAPIVPGTFTDPIWLSTERVLGTDIGARLSVNPEATLTGLMHLLAYGTTFWLTFQLTRTSERAWIVIQMIAWTGTAYALYGIVVYMSGNDWITIYPKWTYQNSLTSTFVNRNSYATFAGLTLLAAVAIFVRHLSPFFALKHPLKSKIVLIVEEIVVRAGFKTLSVVSIAIALLLSTSRGGTSSTAIAFITLFILYLKGKRLKGSHFFGLFSAIAVVVTIVFLAGGNHLSKRLPDSQVQSSLEVRTDIYALTWNAILTSPWKGTGFGTFEDVFPAYRQGNDSPLILWDKAHNTYLENALELGLPAAFLLNLSIALIALQCLRGALSRKRDKIIPTLGIAATVLVGLHSFVDFSLQIPAVSILYACLMGVALSQSWSQRRS